MSRPLPPLGWFRAFDAASRRLSFTAAADELGLTQSAISQQVRSLETRLGVALFVRKPRGLALTDDGRKLAPQVGAALERLAAASEMFEVGSTHGLLTIATSVSVAQWVLAPGMPDFLERHPGARVRIVGAIWPDEFGASIADVEIRFGSAKQVGDGARRLRPDTLVAVAAPTFRPPLEASPLIEAVGTSMGWRRWAQAAGVSATLEATVHVDSYGLALDLARNGTGVALTSSLLAARALRDGDVVIVHDATIEGVEGYHLATRADAPLAAEFERWILERVGSE